MFPRISSAKSVGLNFDCGYPLTHPCRDRHVDANRSNRRHQAFARNSLPLWLGDWGMSQRPRELRTRLRFAY